MIGNLGTNLGTVKKKCRSLAVFGQYEYGSSLHSSVTHNEFKK